MYSLKKSTDKNPYISAFTRSWKLASEAFENESENYITKQKWKSCWNVITSPVLACNWFYTLESPEFLSIYTNRRRLYLKPFRVYMSIRWNKEQKIKVILDTYKFILTKSNFLGNVLTQNEGIEIARFDLSETVEGKLMLGYDERYRKEGELVLKFESEQLGGMIAAAAFSFEEIKKDQWICRIGCIQGHVKNDDENYSKLAQKLLHGLRPKSLIVFAIQELSRQIGMSATYGVGDLVQSYRKKHAIHLPWRHAIHFDYNAIWTESGGEPTDEIDMGWFKLPLTPIQKDMSEIKTHKRAYYRRRYALLDLISQKISETVK
jgi:uncharacterized protein VirK/YbjX